MNILLLILYKILLDILYYVYISDVWDYKFFRNIGGEYLFGWIVYWAFIAIVCPVLKKDNEIKCLSKYILYFLLLFSCVPGLSMCGWGAFDDVYILSFSIYWIVLLTFIRIALSIRFVGEKIHRSNKCFFLMVAVCIVTVLYVFLVYGNGQLFYSSLISEDVYDTRLAWRDMHIPLMLKYILGNTTVVLLVLIMFFLEEKKYLYALMIIAVYYVYFSCGAEKSILFSLVLCVCAFEWQRYISFNSIITASMFVVIMSMSLYSYDLENIAMLTFIRRTMFETNLISYYYYELFSDNLPVIYSVLGCGGISFSEIPNMIGWLYYGSLDTSANNGLIGDSVALFGMAGLVVEPLLWSVYLSVLGSLSREMPISMQAGLGVYWTMIMQNCAVTTAMFSHGGVVLLVMIICLPIIESAKEKLIEVRR